MKHAGSRMRVLSVTPFPVMFALLAGLSISVAIAWVQSIRTNANPLLWMGAPTYSTWTAPPPVMDQWSLRYESPARAHISTERFGWYEDRRPLTPAELDNPFIDALPYAAWRDWTRTWFGERSRLDSRSPPPLELYAFGWPCRCLGHAAANTGTTLNTNLRALTTPKFLNDWLNPATGAPASRLPVGVLWSGLITNTLGFGAGLLVIGRAFAGVRLLRRRAADGASAAGTTFKGRMSWVAPNVVGIGLRTAPGEAETRKNADARMPNETAKPRIRYSSHA